MENEWTELKIDNLPSDILTGDYEFLSPCGGPGSGILGIIGEMLDGEECFYRKCQPKAPTHEEIMSRWWCFSGWWMKVFRYHRIINDPCVYKINDMWVSANYFKDRLSANIPPEV